MLHCYVFVTRLLRVCYAFVTCLLRVSVLKLIKRSVCIPLIIVFIARVGLHDIWKGREGGGEEG